MKYIWGLFKWYPFMVLLAEMVSRMWWCGCEHQQSIMSCDRECIWENRNSVTQLNTNISGAESVQTGAISYHSAIWCWRLFTNITVEHSKTFALRCSWGVPTCCIHNAHFLTTNTIQETLRSMHQKVLDQPPHSTDLSMCSNPSRTN